MIEDRRHKRRRHQRECVWWATETFYKPVYLTRAIASGHHLDVLDFVTNKDINTVHVNNADRAGQTPFHAALLAEDSYSLGSLMSIDDEHELLPEEEAPEFSSAPPPPPRPCEPSVTNSAAAAAAGKQNNESDDHQGSDSYYFESPFMHCGVPYQGLPGLHVGLVHPPPCSADLAKCFILLLYHRLINTVPVADVRAAEDPATAPPPRCQDDEIDKLIEEVQSDVIKCLPVPINWRVLQTVNVEVEDVDGFTLLERCAERSDTLLCRILVRAGAQLRNALAIACASSALTNDQLNVIANFNFLIREFKNQNVFDRACVLNTLKIGIKNLAWACVSELLKLCDLSLTEFESLADYADTLNVSNEWVALVDKSIDDGEVVAPAALHAGKQLALLTHKGCLDHLPVEPNDAGQTTTSSHKENPHRLEVLLEPGKGLLTCRLLNDEQAHNLYVWHEITAQAAWADVARVHDSGYIQKLERLAKAADEAHAEVKADDDTSLSANSFVAARCAAQTVISAIKTVCLDQTSRNAFCCIRPPGHHVGTHGPCQAVTPDDSVADDATGSLGFCLLNNVAIAAAWARYNLYDHGVKKVAIVDFDIHHGNGTESIIRNLLPHRRKLKSHWTLGAGLSVSSMIEDDVDKIWRDLNDSEDVLFVSIHGYDGNFYPGTGASFNYEQQSPPRIVNIGIDETMNNESFLHEFRTGVIGALVNFMPDLILVSAGFDGHVLDGVGGSKFGRLTERDFEKMTRALQRVANTFSRGRLVSVLEGGYNTTLGQASPFARCVYAHVRALATTFGSYQVSSPPADDADANHDDDDDDGDDEPNPIKIDESDSADSLQVALDDEGQSSVRLPIDQHSGTTDQNTEGGGSSAAAGAAVEKKEEEQGK